MPAVPKKVAARLVDGIKKFKVDVEAARARDESEAGTAILVIDMIEEIFGYKKGAEITPEFPVKHTNCDVAIKLDDQLRVIVEIKAIGHKLSPANVDQLVRYVSDLHGVEWGVLTNGLLWQVYRVFDEKPPREELVASFEFLSLDHKSDDDIGLLFLLCKEGWAKSAIEEYQSQRQATSRFMVAAAILSDEALAAVRKALQRAADRDKMEVRVSVDDIKAVVENEVFKREVLEGEKAEESRKKIAKAANVALKES